MRKLIYLTAIIFISLSLNAQSVKKITTTKAGTLSTLLTKTDQTTLTNLTLSGAIDARDFAVLLNLTKLEILDLTNAKILSYKGKGGSENSDTTQYIEDEIPTNAFFVPEPYGATVKLKKIILPNTTKSIGFGAFLACNNLAEVICPPTLEKIGEMAFQDCNALTKFEFGKNITYIGWQAFERCSFIKSFTFNSDKIDGADGTTFYFCSSLKSIYVNTAKPPVFLTMPKGVFESLITDKGNITVFVKPGTLQLFKQDPNWNIFPNIVEL